MENFNDFGFLSSISRNLATSAINSSRSCKLDCIDQGKTFCPDSANDGSGSCCDVTDAVCPRASNDVCSSDIAVTANYNSRYWACGNTPGCSANSYIVTPPFGVTNYVALT